MRAILLTVVLANTACLRKTEFQCANDSSCGPAGHCEPTSFCSFADPGCMSGRSYDQSAGTLAGQCTSGGTAIDGGNVDMPIQMTDGGAVDSPSAGCPAGYNPLTGGETGHLYKLIATADGWPQQQTACKATSASANLAVPQEITEHTALDTLAGASYWVGVTDSATEMTWLDVMGNAQTYLPWQPPAPDNNAGGQGEDCVESLPATHQFNDRRCNIQLPAICECVPP